jgi:hypothetical protein
MSRFLHACGPVVMDPVGRALHPVEVRHVLVVGFGELGAELAVVSWPGGRRYVMIDPDGDGAPEAFRAGATSTDSDLARFIDAMWSQALRLAKQILEGELPSLDERPNKRRRSRRRN